MATKRLEKKIFEVTGGPSPRLVRALTRAGAVSFASRKTFTAAVPTQDRLLALATAGTKIEDADDKAEDEGGEAAGRVP